jgi:plastocyanin
MRRRPVSALAAGALVLLTSACGGSTSAAKPQVTIPAGAGAVVDLKNIAFTPEKVTITAGQTVVWKFDDGSIAHNVTGPGFRSSDRTSGIFVHTFTTPGDYRYNCTIHSGMTGEVIVK